MNRALVVEDEDQVRDLIQAFVEYTGKFSEVDAVTSGEEALKIFEPGKYRIIVLDLIMYEVSGVEVALAVREVDQDVCILAVTGYSQFKDTADLSVAGFNECFIKPLEYKDFFKFVQNM